MKREITIHFDEEMTAGDDGVDVPRGEDLFTVQDDGGHYDDSEQLEQVDAEQKVAERVAYYKERGHEVIVRKDGREVES